MKCIISGCSSTEQSKTFFSFPENDCELLEKWKNAIQMVDLKIINVNNNFICEDHFENIDIKINPGNTKILAPNAVPSIFNCNENITMDSCRFCLKKLHQSNEKMEINEEVRMNFEELMNFKLKINERLPNFTCDKCFNELQSSASIKRRIARIQKKLDELIEDSNFILIKQEKDEIDVTIDHLATEVNYDQVNFIKHDYFSFSDEDGKNQDSSSMSNKQNFENILDINTEFNEENCFKDHKRKLQRKSRNNFYQKSLKCRICTGDFPSKDDLNKHMKADHLDSDIDSEPDGDPLKKSLEKYHNHFKCHECQRNFASVETLKRHCIFYHSTDQDKKEKILNRERTRKELLSRKTMCLVCGKMISNRHIRAHHRRNHDTSSRKLQCDLCGKLQFNKQDMTSHMEMNHVTREPVYCPFCEFTSDLQKYMRDHIRTRHLNKGLVCEICAQTVPNKYKLKNHMRVWHTGEKPYKCKIEGCDKYFVNTTTRGQHIKKEHMYELSICSICGKTFSSKISLRRHFEAKHKEKTVACTFQGCDRKFLSKSKLQTHLSSHTKIRPFTCKYCPHASPVKAALLRHLRDVHMNIKLNCEICDFTTGRKELYRKHVKSKHKDIGEAQFNDLLKRIREIPLPKINLD